MLNTSTSSFHTAAGFTASVRACVRNFKGSHPDRLLKCTGEGATQKLGATILHHSSRDHLPSLSRGENSHMDLPNPHLQLLNVATQRCEAVKWIFVWRAEESSSGVGRLQDNGLCLRRTISQIKEFLQTVASTCWDNLRNVDASAASRLCWINVWAEKAKELKCK